VSRGGDDTAPFVSVVIPTWNGLHLLQECLESLNRSTVSAHVIVVDNGSTDGTVDWLRAAQPGVRLIANPRNLGFAVALNQGVRVAPTGWVAPLNNDALPAPDWLERMLQVGTGDARIGAVASRMMFRSDPNIVSSAGIRVDTAGGAWDLLVGARAWPRAPVPVFGASAGACMYRREMLLDVGLFEETFFAYLEDVDLAWRAQARGWRSVLAPDAAVTHAVSASGGDASTLKRYYLARNKWRVVVRNYPTPVLVPNFPLIIAYDALSVGFAFARRDTAALAGRCSILRELPALLRQRRHVQARSTVAWQTLAATLSRVESPWTLRRRASLVSRLAAGTPT
jgi:GT2 family glycosyltransferase